MNNKQKIKIVIVIIFITILFVIGGIFMFIYYIRNMNIVPLLVTEQTNKTNIAEEVITNTVLSQITITPLPSPTEQILIKQLLTPDIMPMNSQVSMATITLMTRRKIRTYDVMPNVHEKTLKKNIGHLPSSSMPGQEGICVFMGHRDTDFSILKYIEIGDEFIVKLNDAEHTYLVNRIEIVDGDAELRFYTMEGKHLILITCYPFRYTGHAPKKYVIYAS